MIVKGIWKYNVDLNIFQIPVKITNFETQKNSTVICLFDTGFSGYIGIDSQTINFLQLPKIGEGFALTVNGTTKFENYAGKVEIVNTENISVGVILNQERELINLDTTIIPIQKFNLAILGIKAIKKFHWLLLPDKNLLMMVD